MEIFLDVLSTKVAEANLVPVASHFASDEFDQYTLTGLTFRPDLVDGPVGTAVW